MKLLPRHAILLLAALLIPLAACDNSVEQDIIDPEMTPAGWNLVWSDEFDGSALDESKWSFQLGDGCPALCGWGNAELQSYERDNVTVANGMLTITAEEESEGEYTSGRILTIDKGDWRYGRFEIRAKLPIGQGIWPAIWMMPTESVYGVWAASGEIDIMEAIGNKPGEVFGTLHYGGTFPANVFSGNEFQLASGTFADDFFVFGLEWEEGEIRWYVNNVLYATQTAEDWYTTASDDPNAPFDERFHLILNVAVGGNLPGSPDATTSFPQEMVVDYIRVYERAD